MLKRWGRVILVMLLACFLLTTCTCAHKWKEATCTEPKTCVYCGMTEGEPLWGRLESCYDQLSQDLCSLR